MRNDATGAGVVGACCSVIENPPDDARRGAEDTATGGEAFGPTMRMTPAF